MNEKELLEQLRESSRQITPPDSLRPENIEKMLYAVFQTQEFDIDDRLIKIINSYAQDELDEESLDLVYAARKNDFSEFIRRINSEDKK